MPIYTKIQLRRDTTANWSTTNPVLAQGEAGIETDSGKRIRIGDGSTAWNSLADAAGPPLATLGIYNITDPTYGAKGDGVTDDAPAIQKAINALLTNGGGWLVIPPVAATKYYRLHSAGLTINVTGGQWIGVIGGGMQSYLFCDKSGTDALTIEGTAATPKDNTFFSDFAVGTSSAGQDGIVLSTSHRNHFRNVWVTGAGRNAWNIEGCFLNQFFGGGFSLNIGSPGGVLQGTPLYGVQLVSGGGNSGSNGNSFYGFCVEGATEATKAITGATNATPIVVTAVGHGYATGDVVGIASVGGNTAANGAWVITKVDADTFSLNDSVGSGAYTSGGTAARGCGVYVGGTSYNNSFYGGALENNIVGAMPDKTSVLTMFDMIDISSNTVADLATNYRYAGTVSYRAAVAGGRFFHADGIDTMSRRLQSASDATPGNYIEERWVQGVPTARCIGTDTGFVRQVNGVSFYRVEVGSDAAGANAVDAFDVTTYANGGTIAKQGFTIGSGMTKTDAHTFGTATNVADGGTIAHGIKDVTGTTQIPHAVSLIGSGGTATDIVSVSALDGVNITVAIKTTGGAAGANKTIYWQAWY